MLYFPKSLQNRPHLQTLFLFSSHQGHQSNVDMILGKPKMIPKWIQGLAILRKIGPKTQIIVFNSESQARHLIHAMD